MLPSISFPRAGADVVAADLDYCCVQLSAEFERMSGSRLLLTGGGGFLGYYLVQTLLEWNRRVPRPDGIELTVIDNYLRGVPDWLNAIQDDRLQLSTHDIRTPVPADLGEFDYYIHGASIASPTFYRQHPIATMDANVTGLRLLLERARNQQEKGRPVVGFLFFSSSEIYGDPEPAAIPTPETYPGRVSCTGPRACYDESKRYGETLCVNFARQYGLPITIARPFNNYGPGLEDHRPSSDSRPCARPARRSRPCAALGRHPHPHVLLRRRCRDRLLQGVGTRACWRSRTTSAVRLLKSPSPSWPQGWRTGDASCSGTPAGWCKKRARMSNISRTIRSGGVLISARRETSWASHPRLLSTRGLRRTLLWYSEHRAGQEA